MDLQFDTQKAIQYKSNSQRIRVLTEDWVARNLCCPICGKAALSQYTANRPVADFFCENCKSDFELKSKKDKLGKLIADGAYDTMISRITSMQNPNFLLMTYCNDIIKDLVLVPNHFFVHDIIEKRKPLSSSAKRAGWVGCNINIENIPESGKIFIIKDECETDKNQIILEYSRIKELTTKNLESRSWIIDILNCIDKVKSDDFSLKQIYKFENELKGKHPRNNFIKDKIRQQLQYLRDKGFIQFTTRGNYTKVK